MTIRVPYTRIEWLDVNGASVPQNGQYAISVEPTASNVRLSNLLVHGFNRTSSRGISVEGSATIRNSFLYRNKVGIGIAVSNASVQNCSLWPQDTASAIGLQAGSGLAGLVVENVISTGHATDFSSSSTPSSFNNNLSGDTTATSWQPGSGSGNLTGKTAANQFENVITTPFNLHLKTGADALNVGKDLSASFLTDIDGQTRPISMGWDIGADEALAAATTLAPEQFRSIGTRAAHTGTGTITVTAGSTTVTQSGGTGWKTDTAWPG